MVLFGPVSPPENGIVLSQDNVEAKNRSRNYGNGRLLVAEQCVCWVADPSPGSNDASSGNVPTSTGLQLSYYDISLHAISKDPNSFPEECIYMLLDGVTGADPGSHTDMENGSGDNDESMEEEGATTLEGDAECSELCFVPQDKSKLEAIFAAMSTCQALHPDPDDAESESENDDDLADATVGENQFDDDEADQEPEEPS